MGDTIRYLFEVVTDEAVRELEALSRGFNSLSTGFKKISSLGNSFSKTMRTGASSIKKLTTAASALSGVALGKVFADATKEAIDYYEALNLFQVAMKGSIEQGNEFIDTISEWYGLDPKNLMQYTGTFYEMAYAVGAPDKAAQQLSTSLTALSVDLASLFNVDVEKVTDNLTSGIRGMSRAVVKYGLDLRATTVEAYANSLGITQQYESMNEASREILRYLVAVKQARDATGDFGRTIEQPANQLRVFKEQMSQVGRAIGTFIIQPLQAALPIINGFTMAIRIMLETLAAIMGFKLEVDNANLTDTSDAVASIGNSADDTKKKIKSLLAPFDELNVLQENTSSGSGGATLEYGEVDPLLLKALDEAQYKLEEVRMKAMDTRDAVLAFFGFKPDGDSWIYSPELFEKNLKEKFPNWQKTIEALFNFNYEGFLSNVSLLFGSFKRIAQEAISIVVQDLSNLLGIDLSDSSIASWIDNLNQKFFELRKWIVENESNIAQFVARFMEIAVAFTAVKAVAGILAPIFSGIAGALTIIGSVVGIVGGGFSTLLGIFRPLGALASTLSGFFLRISSTLGAMTTGLSLAGQSGTGFVAVIQTLLGALSSLSGVIVAIGAAMAAVFVGGFIEWMFTSETFKQYLTEWGEALSRIATGVKDIFVTVFNTLKDGIHNVATRFSSAFESISAVIQNLLDALAGIVDFVAGVLTGDWKRALNGLYDAWYGLCASLLNTIGAILNVAISAINNFVQHVVDKVFDVVNDILRLIPDWIRGLLGLPSYVSAPSVQLIKPIPVVVPPPAPFADGGVVTGPTRALIGEAGKPEMVMPLDNSPQMLDLIDKIADKVNTTGETVVKVYIGDREWDAFTYESSKRGAKLVGAQPVMIGG